MIQIRVKTLMFLYIGFTLTTTLSAQSNNRIGENVNPNTRLKRYLPISLLGQPPSTTPHTPPFMVAQANNNQYQYMPLKDDGTVYELDPCPETSSPSGGGGSNVFALMTFGVVTANVLINAVANVNNNNNNNNNNENNNNDNINNENISSNMDSNTNDNTIMGRAYSSVESTRRNSTGSCSCSSKGRRSRRSRVSTEKQGPGLQMHKMHIPEMKIPFMQVPEAQKNKIQIPKMPPKKMPNMQVAKIQDMAMETPYTKMLKMQKPKERMTKIKMPNWLMACAPRIICEAFKSASSSNGFTYFLENFSGLSSIVTAMGTIPLNELNSAQNLGLKGGNCNSAFDCKLLSTTGI